MAGQITHSNFRQAVFGDGDLQALIFNFQHYVLDVFTFDLPGFTLNDLCRTVLRVNYEFTKGQTHVRWAPFIRQDDELLNLKPEKDTAVANSLVKLRLAVAHHFSKADVSKIRLLAEMFLCS